MFSNLLMPSLLLFCSVILAGQYPLSLQFQPNSCSIAEQNALLNSTVPEVQETHQHSSSCNHHHQQRPKQPSRYAPWTHKPRCLSDDNTYEEYCVYTNASFANGRGISFFTKPEIAEKVISLPAFTSHSLPSHVNNFNNPPWEIRNISGRGNGLFATRRLERGDLVLADTPAGVYMSDAFPADFEIGYKYLHKSFDQLPQGTKEIYMRMAAYAAGDEIMERINTNAFAGEFEGEPHFMLYPETALMNHDCRPNAMYYHDPKTLIHSTHASRTILPGEEITITYINLLQPLAGRQDLLQSIWGFTCTCPLCSSPTKNHASEANIQMIIKYQTALADWSPDSVATPAMALRLIELYEEEHLHAASGTAHLFAALAWNAIGEKGVRRARKHAEKALEVGMVGSEGDVSEMEALLKTPEAHWSWGVRRGGRGF